MKNNNIFLKKLKAFHLTILLLFHSSLMADDLHKAAEDGNIEEVSALLKEGIDPNSPDFYGDISLHKASRRNQPKIINLLMENGANVNAQNIYNETPFHISGMWGSSQNIPVLATGKNTDINAQDMWGWTTLHLAVQEEHLEVVFELIKQPGINTHIQTISGYKALDIAKDRRNPELIRLLERYDSANLCAQSFRGSL